MLEIPPRDRMSAEGRPAPTSSGQLARTPLPHLLVYASERQLTGTFQFRAPDATTAQVLLAKGHPAKIRLSSPQIYLGQVLLETGAIDAATHDASLRDMAASRKLHGTVLLARGAIDRTRLEQGLQLQLLQKMVQIARMPVATVFEFYADWDGLADFGAEPTPMDAYAATWAAIREQPALDHVKAAIDRMSRGRLRLTKTAQLDRFGFTSEERRWIDLLRVRPMRLDDFFAAAQVNERITRLAVYCLAITKQLELTAEEEPAAPPVASAPADPEAPPSSSPQTPGNKVGRITLSRQRVPTSPSIVEEHSSPRLPALDRRASPPPDSPETAIPAVSPVLESRRKDIVDRAATIDKQNYYEMLGVAHDAKVDDVKAAYLALARVWHPDRLPVALSDVKDACGRVFARMSEAHATLTDKEKRERYSKLMKEGGETPEQQQEIVNVVNATVEFQKAEICLKKNDIVKAEELARRALELDPNQADYIALVAWIHAQRPEALSAEGTQACIVELDRALEINERCERAYFYRAMLYKRHNREGLAFKDFKKVNELNPKNIDAQRELRLYDMRGGPPRRLTPVPSKPPGAKSPSIAPKGGLFQKFFKK
jgi:hypothetical protein